MKYLAVLAVLVVIYLVLARESPVAEVTEAVAQSEAAPLTQGPRDPAPATGGSALKRPIDRTHAVLEQVKARNGDGEF
jgi:hypothetical protein